MPELTTRTFPPLVAVLLAAAAAGFAWFLYRREQRLVTRSIARGLVALRLALVVACAALVADPVLVRRELLAHKGQLLVVVDGTRSFAHADPSRSASQVDDEARALELAREEALRARRFELAARATGGSWRQELEERFEVSWYALGGGLEPPPAGGEEPAWPRTDLLRAVADEAARQPREALAGIVLFTDARHNTPNDPRVDARRIGSLGARLVIVGVGALEAPPDIELLSLEAAEKVFADDEVTVQATLRATGLPVAAVTLQASVEGSLVESRPVALVPGQTAEVSETFHLPAGAGGRKRIAVQAVPVAGEASAGNNAMEAWIEVLDGPARVLLVDGAPRWEHRYLRETLAREKRIELAAHLASPPPDRRLPPGFPRAPEALFAHDVIILGDLGPEVFTRSEVETLCDFVAGRGGTLVLIAGERAMPYAWTDTPLAELLPVELRWPPPPRGLGRQEARTPFVLALAPRGETSEITRLIAGRERNVELWELLSRPQWLCPTAGPRVGAELLVTTRPELAGGVLAASRGYRAGRVLFLGADSTWRWRFRLGDELHRRFWGQAIRWAVASRLESEDERVKLGTDAIAYDPGGQVVIDAQLKDLAPADGATGAPPLDAVLRRRLDGKEARLRLEPLPRSGGRYRGSARLADLGFDAPPAATPPGSTVAAEEIEITAASPWWPPAADGAIRAARTIIVERPADPEARAVTCDAALAAELATLAGGVFLPLGRYREATRHLSEKRFVEERSSELRPLDHPSLLFTLLFGVLAAEWILRKRAHLV